MIRLTLQGRVTLAKSIVAKAGLRWRSVFALLRARDMYYRKVQESVVAPAIPAVG